MLQDQELNKLCQQGQEHMAAERFQEADAAFGRALELDARDARALHGRALCLRRLEKYAEGHHVLNRALFLYPTDIELLTERGFLHLDQQHYEEAVEAFDRTLAADPNNKYALEGRIGALRSAGRFDEAGKAIAEALEKYPQSNNILTERARIYYDQKKYDEAVEAFVDAGNEDALYELVRYGEMEEAMEAAISRLPRSVRFLNLRAIIYSWNSQYNKAVEAFDRTLAVDPNNEDALEGKIAALRLERRFDEARKAIAEAIGKYPQSNNILTERAELYYAENKYDEAVEGFIEADTLLRKFWSLRGNEKSSECGQFIEVALKRLPKHVALLNERGRLYLSGQRYDKAVEAFDGTLAVEPNNEDALEGKIRALRLECRFNDASKAITEAIRKYPQSNNILTERAELYCAEKKYDKAVEGFIEADREDILLQRIWSLRKDKKFSECGQFIEEALKRLPKHVDLLNERGYLAFDQRQYDKAANAFNQTLGIEPTNSPALIWKTIALRVQRNFPEAERTLVDGLARLPQSLELLNQRGWLQIDQGRYDNAVEAFDRTLDADPNHANEDALQWKIRSLREQRNPAGDKALEDAIEDALKRQPHSAKILYERGQWHYDRDEFKEADEWCAKAISCEPYYHESYFLRAEALRQLNRSDDALKLLQDLKRSNPEDLEVRGRLGWFNLYCGELDRAKEEFDSILKTDSMNTTAISGVGAVYVQRDQYESAEHKFRRALELEPNESAWHRNLAFTLVRQAKKTLSSSAPARMEATWLQTLKLTLPSTNREGSQPVGDCFREAEEHCRTALQLSPNFGAPYGLLGIIAFRRGNLIESEDLFKKSITLNPKEGYYADLGALYAQVGR